MVRGIVHQAAAPVLLPDFISGWLRWSIRLSAYEFLLTDAYPPFSMSEEPGYPVQLAIPPPRQLNRLAVFFRFILVIPASIVALVLGGSFTTLLSIVGWLVTLVTGRLPRTFFDIFSVVLRYQARLGGYYLMLTPEYPHQPFGDTPPPRYPGWELEPVPAARAGLIVLVVLNVLGLIAYVAVTAAASHGTVQNLNATVQVQKRVYAAVHLTGHLRTQHHLPAASRSSRTPAVRDGHRRSGIGRVRELPVEHDIHRLPLGRLGIGGHAGPGRGHDQ